MRGLGWLAGWALATPLYLFVLTRGQWPPPWLFP